MSVMNIDQKVEQAHATLKAEYHKKMKGWGFFRGLDDFAQNMIVLEMIESHNEGQRKGWLDGYTKGMKD